MSHFIRRIVGRSSVLFLCACVIGCSDVTGTIQNVNEQGQKMKQTVDDTVEWTKGEVETVKENVETVKKKIDQTAEGLSKIQKGFQMIGSGAGL